MCNEMFSRFSIGCYSCLWLRLNIRTSDGSVVRQKSISHRHGKSGKAQASLACELTVGCMLYDYLSHAVRWDVHGDVDAFGLLRHVRVSWTWVLFRRVWSHFLISRIESTIYLTRLVPSSLS
jgi:hypothetical protein